MPLVVLAQSLPGAAAFDHGPGAEGHGWLVVGPESAPKIVHVPPRGSVDVGGGRLLSGNGGTVRLAARLNAMPEAVAAEGRKVYLIFPTGANGKRLVLRASVSPAPVGNLWELEQQERLDAMPSLEAAGTLCGLVATDLGLAALIRDESAAKATLWLLRAGVWSEADVPELESKGGLRLVPTPQGLRLLAWSGQGAVLWRGVAGGSDKSPTIEWTRTPLAALGLNPDQAPLNPCWMAGALVFGVRAESGLELREARSSGVRTLATLPEVGARFAMTGLPQSGRIMVVWTEPKPGAVQPEAGKPVPEPVYLLREVSVHTGRTLYAGAPAEAWPFSRLEFRLLALLLMAVVVGVLLFVLRPDQGDAAVLLPQGCALAGPWQRAVAGGIDLAFAWVIVSSSLGVTFESLLYPVLGARLVPVILLVIGVACFHCTLGEWLSGRSIGKVITGCRVVVVGATGDPGAGERSPESPAFGAALIRNLVRWGVPPLGMAGLASPNGRHRGDLLARTAVVVVVEPEGGE